MADISCMSFNILGCDTHSAGWEMQPTRYKYIMDTIRSQDPDLIGIQEACDGKCKPEKKEVRCALDWDWCATMRDSVTALGYEAFVIKDHPDFDRPMLNLGNGQIIFYKKDRFELKDNGIQCYRHDPVRHFQWVKLYDTKYGRDILFTNTHFSINPKLQGERCAELGEANRTVEAGLLLNFWCENCDENTALFATGDYNSRSTAICQSVLRRQRFKPSNILAEKFDDRGTMHWGREATTIDFCFVNPTAQTVKEYKVMANSYETDADRTKFPRAGYASDHRAIMTYCDYKDIVKPAEEE